MNKYGKYLGITMLGASLLFAGCGANQQEKQAEEAGITWQENVDGHDSQMKITAAPEHAVSMSQATTEMLLALGLEDKMAGSAFKEEDILPSLQEAYEKVPVLAEKWPSYEVFMAAKPDFTTGWGTAFTKRAIPAEKIEAAGIPIFIPDSMQETNADLETNFADMEKLGDIFGVRDRADAWVAEQRSMLEKAQGEIKDLPKVKVFVFDSEDGEPFTAFEGYTTNVLRLVGAENVMSGQGVEKTWAKGSWESVVKADPEVIIVVDYSTSARNDDDFQEKIAKLKANPQLANIAAVRNDRFVKVRLSAITPGVRTVEALTRIAKEIHGAQ